MYDKIKEFMKAFKTIVIILILTAFMGVFPAFAEESAMTSESTEAVSDSGYVNTEKEIAKYTWVYYVAAGVTAAGVAAAAIIISKKVK